VLPEGESEAKSFVRRIGSNFEGRDRTKFPRSPYRQYTYASFVGLKRKDSDSLDGQAFTGSETTSAESRASPRIVTDSLVCTWRSR
jgi:hypothetical protein